MKASGHVNRGNEPSIQFSQDLAPSHGPRYSNLGWLLLLLIVWPFVGFVLGLQQIQDARHSRIRGNPRPVTFVAALYVATLASFLLSVLVLLLFA